MELTQALRKRLANWLAPRVDAALDADALQWRRPAGGGWSNETLIVSQHDDPIAVIRLQPEGAAMFPHYDLGREHALLGTLARLAVVPTPPLLGADLEGELFGRPALVSGFVHGHVPADTKPGFAEAGFLFAASAAVQRAFHVHLLAALAALHRVPASECAALRLPIDDGSLAANLARLEMIWQWDRGARFPRVIDDAFAGLRSAMPAPVLRCLLWGDARPANVIVADDGCTLRALLDWELAELGPPALDVAWLLEMNRMRTIGAGVAALPGFLDDDESVAEYERQSGTTIEHLAWFRCFSALKMAVLMHRFLRVSVHRQQLDAEHRVLGDTVASRRVAELLDAL